MKKCSAATAAQAAAAHSSRGAFIVLEGVDRCGKTTQCALLKERLLQQQNELAGNAAAAAAVEAMRFPDRTTQVGQMIDQYLRQDSELDDRAVHLLFSANRWEASRRICSLLKSGTHIICDRYAYSGVAFSSAKVAPKKGGKGMDDGGGDSEGQRPPKPLLSLEWCQNPDRGLPAPDHVIFLDLSQDEAELRGGYGGERYEKRDMQVRVRQRFAELQRIDEGANAVPWTVVDAARDIEQVHEDIWSIVQRTLRQVQERGIDDDDENSSIGGKPLGKMWEDGSIDLSQYDVDDAVVAAGKDDEKKEN